jgi:polysaccharide deacetylase family protein (PEP-CTERM system associated)
MLETNVLSVDVEDYFHVQAFADVADRSRWDSYQSRVDQNTRHVLDLLDECGVKGTFFILGWVAERFPQLVRAIVARGHEPACHSYWHRLIHEMEPAAFDADTRRAKDCIEQAAGRQIYGYRAPSYSVTARSLWALEVLAAAGFTYDSSIFPIRHDIYGIPSGPRFPCRLATASGPIVEYPLTTFRVFGNVNLPVGGGGYLRIFPFWYTRLGFGRARNEQLPLIANIHPWEIDPSQPRIPGRLTSRLRHYTNLSKTADRLRRLLALGRFASFEDSGLATAARNTNAIEWGVT